MSLILLLGHVMTNLPVLHTSINMITITTSTTTTTSPRYLSPWLQVPATLPPSL